MIGAIKEYNSTVMKPWMKWCKKHWKGFAISLILIEFVAYGVGYLVGYHWITSEEISKEESECQQ